MDSQEVGQSVQGGVDEAKSKGKMSAGRRRRGIIAQIPERPGVVGDGRGRAMCRETGGETSDGKVQTLQMF